VVEEAVGDRVRLDAAVLVGPAVEPALDVLGADLRRVAVADVVGEEVSFVSYALMLCGLLSRPSRLASAMYSRRRP
jgi:hypothetical protein